MHRIKNIRKVSNFTNRYKYVFDNLFTEIVTVDVVFVNIPPFATR